MERPAHLLIRPISQSAFYVDGKDSFSAALHRAVSWMRERCPEIPEGADNGEPFRSGIGAKFGAEALKLESGEGTLWGATLEDRREQATRLRTWVTEISLRRRGNQTAVGVRLTQIVRGFDMPFHVSRPNLVQTMITDLPAIFDGQRLGVFPARIESSDDVHTFIKFLVDPNRRLPVVAISLNEDGSTSIDLTAVGKRVSGLAHLSMLSPDASWSLTKELDKSNSVFLGATRLFRPKFDPDNGNPFDHPLWTIRRGTAQERNSYLERIAQYLSSTSVREFSNDPDFPRYDEVRHVVAKRSVDEIKIAGAVESELSTLYAEENDRLRAELATRQQEHDALLQHAGEELARAEAGRDEALAERVALRERILFLEQEQSKTPAATEEDQLESFAEIEQWCVKHLAGSIWIASKAVRESEKNGQFEDPAFFGKTLLMLRDFLVPMKRTPGNKRRSAYQEQLKAMRLDDQPCFSDPNAIKKYPEYRVDYAGDRHWCENHIKFGGGRINPRKQFRIYYHWHSTDQMLLIGHMPTHLDNFKTN